MIFKQAFRIAFVTFIWKQYKAWIISSLLLLLSFFLIGKIHTDLLPYWELQQDTSQTAASIIYKWLAYLGSTLLYFLYHYFRPKNQPTNKETEKLKHENLEQELANLSKNDDPFNEIRNKDKLRSRSDFILEKSNKNSSSKR